MVKDNLIVFFENMVVIVVVSLDAFKHVALFFMLWVMRSDCFFALDVWKYM